MNEADAALPRILVFSEAAISKSHGTGAIFLRNFSGYPADRLCNAYLGAGADLGLARNIDLNAERWPATVGERLAALPARLWNRARPRRTWALSAGRAAGVRAREQAPFAPDLIYGIAYAAEGLAVLESVVAALPRSVPLLLHFHDFWPNSDLRFRPLLRRLGRRAAAIWAISDPIAEYVTAATGRPCLVDPGFHIEVPATHKREHREFGPDFRAVVLGNFWNPDLLDAFKAVWRECQAQAPELGPAHWYCHPQGVENLRALGHRPEPELQSMGFLTGDALWSRLAEADLALVPFGLGAEPATDYERYSIPSRLTELAPAGLPIFGFGGPATPLARYLSSKGLGRHAPMRPVAEAGRALLALIRDRAARESLGRQARRMAEAKFPLGAFQDLLYRRMAALAAGQPPP